MSDPLDLDAICELAESPDADDHADWLIGKIPALCDELEATRARVVELENELDVARAALHQILTFLAGIAEAALEPKEHADG